MDRHHKQVIVNTRPSQSADQYTEDISFFNSDGTPFTGYPLPAVVVGTAIGTAAKTTTSAQPRDNTLVPIKFTNGNSAAAMTVAFAGGAARTVHLGGATPTGAESTIAANGVAMFWFDGTILHQLGVYA